MFLFSIHLFFYLSFYFMLFMRTFEWRQVTQLVGLWLVGLVGGKLLLLVARELVNLVRGCRTCVRWATMSLNLIIVRPYLFIYLFVYLVIYI
jgi:hypothetical protein